MKVDEQLLRKSLDTAIDFSVIKKEGHKPKKRNFDESVDLIINLKDIDLKDPKQRIDKELILPFPVTKDGLADLCVIASGEMLLQAKKTDIDTMSDDDIEQLNEKEKKEKKKFVKKYEFFIVEDKMMPTVARYLARFLGPRGKMPKPFPAGYGIVSSVEEMENAIDRYKNVIRIQVKKTPIVQVKVGKKSMEMKKVLENIETVVDFVVDQMPHKYNNIRSMYIKTTMGKPVKVDEDFLKNVGGN
ncbi:MAG: 50S ribosomal protein L1 [Candidatus Lokiarchaeota archaeon]|nr:50S ribosomal protein L1 [Candidatus Lokiarchaeota archaeon]MBD3200690.1 50S ribosomal protein L1 [Candidatus Lokiarchaeota archaeon]